MLRGSAVNRSREQWKRSRRQAVICRLHSRDPRLVLCQVWKCHLRGNGPSRVRRCVARFGTVGGCRFAPNVLCLPHGLVYGRVEPEDAQAMIESYQAGTVYLSRFRGRSSYFRTSVQAADYFVRARYMIVGINDLQLVESAEMYPGCWRVVFQSSPSAVRYEVVVSAEASKVATYKSCSAVGVSVRGIFK